MDFVLSYTLWTLLVAGWACFVLALGYIWCQRQDLKGLANDRDHYKRLLTMLDEEPVQTLEEIVIQASYPQRQPAGYTTEEA